MGYISMQDIIIVKEIEKIVEKTNTVLSAKDFPYTVYYDYGHPKEVNERLKEKSESVDIEIRKQKFPLIILLTDVPINRNITGMYGTARLRFLICNFTEEKYTSQQRTDLNFIPILHPIKTAFLDQIEKHGQFVFDEELSCTETDCYYYGSQINDKNVFNDRIDAIEITDLNVNITAKYC